MYPGGYTQAREQRRLERTTAVRERAKARREQKTVRREMAKRRERAAG